jgi:hypothetical protein
LEAIEAQIKEDDLINRKKKTGNGPRDGAQGGVVHDADQSSAKHAEPRLDAPAADYPLAAARLSAARCAVCALRHRETAITGPLVLQECYLTGPSFVVVGWAIGDHQIRVQTI